MAKLTIYKLHQSTPSQGAAKLVLTSSDGHRNEVEGRVVSPGSPYTKQLTGVGPFKVESQPGTVFESHISED